jgi:hypothetical protein
LKIIIMNPEKPSIQEWQWNMPSGMHAKDEKSLDCKRTRSDHPPGMVGMTGLTMKSCLWFPSYGSFPSWVLVIQDSGKRYCRKWVYWHTAKTSPSPILGSSKRLGPRAIPSILEEGQRRETGPHISQITGVCLLAQEILLAAMAV